MTNSGTSTERPWQIYLVMSMIAATAAVMMSRYTHPAALLLLSAAVIASGVAALTLHRALAGFFSRGEGASPVSARTRDVLERNKALVLRSIKELEFDHRMGKVSAADFADLSSRLRARALELMTELEERDRKGPRATAMSPELPADRPPSPCPTCATVNDRDAKFCKNCGTKL
jgi:hypothetical protein